MGTIKDKDEAKEQESPVDHMDELQHLLSDAPTSRTARNELRRILAEVREEHARMTQQQETGEPMTPRQFGYLEMLTQRNIPEPEPTRKQAAELLLEKLELAMFQREELTESAEDGSE